MAKVLALLDTSDRYYEGSVYTNTYDSLFNLVGTNHPYSLSYDEVRIYEGTGLDGINDNPPGHTSYFVSIVNYLAYEFAANYGQTNGVTDIIFGMLVNVDRAIASFGLRLRSPAAALLLSMGHNGSGAFQFYPMNSYDSDLDTNFPLNEWKFLEVRMRFGVGDGQFRTWVDGALAASKDVVSFSGSAHFAEFFFQATYLKFNDFYVIIGTDGTLLEDSDRLGPIRVANLSSATSSVTSGWSGSDGNSVDNYQLIDETLQNWSSTDYVSASSTGLQDTYRWNLSSLSGREVNGVYAETSLQRTDINAASASVIAKSSTDVALRPDIAVPLNYTRYGHGFLLQPDGSTWTSTGLADAEFGVQRR